MRAKIRQFSAGHWKTVEVLTEPLRVRLEGEAPEGGFDSNIWAKRLPPALVDGKSTEFLENPEGWLSTMSHMAYTRITVQLL